MPKSIYTEFLNAFSDAWRLMMGVEWTGSIASDVTRPGRHVMAYRQISDGDGTPMAGSFSVTDKQLSDPASAYQIVADIAATNALLEEMDSAYNKGGTNA